MFNKAFLTIKSKYWKEYCTGIMLLLSFFRIIQDTKYILGSLHASHLYARIQIYMGNVIKIGFWDHLKINSKYLTLIKVSEGALGIWERGCHSKVTRKFHECQSMPRMLCNGNGAISHLQTEMGLVKNFH